MREKNRSALSFVGGLVVVSVVLGVLLVKNDKLRAEAKEQVASLLKVAEKAAGQMRHFVESVAPGTAGQNSAIEDSNIKTKAAPPDTREYDTQWELFT